MSRFANSTGIVLSNTERRLISQFRQMKQRAGKRPFTLIVNSPGGQAPVQTFEAVPLRAVDKKSNRD